MTCNDGCSLMSIECGWLPLRTARCTRVARNGNTRKPSITLQSCCEAVSSPTHWQTKPRDSEQEGCVASSASTKPYILKGTEKSAVAASAHRRRFASYETIKPDGAGTRRPLSPYFFLRCRKERCSEAQVSSDYTLHISLLASAKPPASPRLCVNAKRHRRALNGSIKSHELNSTTKYDRQFSGEESPEPCW